jgi:hypothetical protein
MSAAKPTRLRPKDRRQARDLRFSISRQLLSVRVTEEIANHRPDPDLVFYQIFVVTKKLSLSLRCADKQEFHEPEKESQEVRKRRSDLLRQTIEGIGD